MLNIQAQLGEDLGGVLSHTPALEPIEDPNADESDEPRDESEGRAKGLLLGLVGVGALAVGGFFAWPFISDFLDSPERPPAALASTAPDPNAEPTQHFVLDGDDMYLEGSVPDQATSNMIETAASDVLGPERVINNFEISEDAVYNPSKPVQLSVAETVQFGTGEAALREQYEPLIALAVELLTNQPDARLSVIGHTDDVGDVTLNEELSLRRATTVMDEIVARGIDAGRLTALGRGESEPIASNDTVDGRAANRRVEFLITGLLN